MLANNIPAPARIANIIGILLFGVVGWTVGTVGGADGAACAENAAAAVWPPVLKPYCGSVPDVSLETGSMEVSNGCGALDCIGSGAA